MNIDNCTHCTGSRIKMSKSLKMNVFAESVWYEESSDFFLLFFVSRSPMSNHDCA